MDIFPHLTGYKITSEVHRGNNSTVYCAQAKGGLTCAIKVFTTNSGQHEQHHQTSDCFLRELDVLRTSNHPNLVRLHDFGCTLDTAQGFLSLEWLEGENFIAASERVTKRDFYAMVAQVCRAVDHIHDRGIVHGDLKPQNLMVVTGSTLIPDAPTIKLLDFGFSTPLGSAPQAGIQGSPHYMAPEVVQGAPRTIASDLYSIGVILYECLSGKTPFDGKDVGSILRQHIQDSPPPITGEMMRELHPLIQQLLSKDPTRRPSTCAEVLRQINAASMESPFPLHTIETWQASISIPPAPVRCSWEATYRQFITEAITQKVQSTPHILLVLGEKGSGKTRLLREIGICASSMGIRAHMMTAPSPMEIGEVTSAFSRQNRTSHDQSAVALCIDDFTPSTIDALARSLKSLQCTQHARLWTISLDITQIGKETRDGIATLLSSCGQVVTLSLRAFEPADVDSVLRGSLGVEDIQPAVVDFLYRESGGAPALLAQVAAAALDQRVMVSDRQTLRLEGDPDNLTIPSSLALGFKAHLDTLSAQERQVLVPLAAADDSFESIDISTLAGIDCSLAFTLCADLAQRGFLRASGGSPSRFSISSHLHARIILSGVSPISTRAIHTRLAEWYQRQPITPRALEHIVTHSVSAEVPDEILRHSMVAAREAESRKDDHAAAKYYRLALRCHPIDQSVLAAASIGHSNALMRIGRLDEALLVLETLRREYALPPIVHYEVEMGKCAIADVAGDLPSMERAARSALNIALETRMQSETIRAMSDLGSALCGLQRQAEGLPLLYRTLSKARARREKAIIAEVLLSIAKCHWMRGNYLQALRYQRRSAVVSRSRGTTIGPVCAETNVGIVQGDLGLYAKARKTLLIALKTAPWYSSGGGKGSALNNIGETYRAQGRWKLALRSFRSAALANRGSGAQFTSLTVDNNEAHVLIGTGHYSAALSHLSHKIPKLHAIGSGQGVSHLFANWGSLLLATGRLDLGERVTAHAVQLAGKTELLSSMLELRTLQALSLLGAGRLRESHLLMSAAMTEYERRSPMDIRMLAGIAVLQIERALGLGPQELDRRLQPLLDRTRKKRMVRFTTWALILRGEALLEAGRTDEAENDLTEAVMIAQKNADRPQFWKASYWLGRVFEQRLQYERALGSYRVAALTVNELAMDIDDDRYREPFLAQPEMREVQARFERLRAEVGRKARHDIAAMSRSEKVSRRMLNALNAIGQKLTSILDLDDLLTNLLDLSIENVRAERGLVFLRDEATGEMRLACARNMDKESLDEVSSFSRSVIKRVAEGHTLLEVDVGKDPALSAFQSLVIHEIKSILCVPMRTRGRTVGVIYLDTRRAAQMFTDKERAFVESFASQAAIAIENARVFGDISAENARLKREAAGKGRFESLIGTSPAMMKLSDTIAGVMGSDCNVLVAGESGTGKELVAKAIHYNGPRQKRKFVAIDCGALPESLLEAELFGFARGAFTGADRDKVGLIEESHGGTLFLDEITNTTVALQAKLLRVLQEHEVRRLGENSPRRVDARIIAATNADIAAQIREGKFRSDLYYRLNVVTIEVPPLRDRREDIPLLVEHFLRQRSPDEASRKRLAPGVVEALGRYDWPGNVRELENVIERLLVLARGRVISQDALPDNIRAAAGLRDTAAIARSAALDGGNNGPNGGGNGHKNGEHLMVEDALRRFGGDKAKAARFIGWNRQKLYRKMKDFGIPADYGRTV